MINNRELTEEQYKGLIWETIDCITSHGDYLEIATKFGTFNLKRYIHKNFRNMPKFNLKPIAGNDETPLSCKYDLTYIYGCNEKKLIIDFDCLTISEMN